MPSIRPLMGVEIEHRSTRHMAVVYAFGRGHSYVGGTAVIVGPGIAITAKHVLEEIFSQFQVGPTTGNISLDVCVTQVDGTTWFVYHSSVHPQNDLAVLSLRPGRNRRAAQHLPALPLTLNIPAPGIRTTALGFPQSQLSVIPPSTPGVDPLVVTASLIPTASEGLVLEPFEQRRDPYLVNYPSISIEAEYTPGMSGGPVFDEHRRVCGIVCRGGEGELQNYSIASALWPIAMLSAEVVPEFAQPLGLDAGRKYDLYSLAIAGYLDIEGTDRLYQARRADGTLVMNIRPLG